MTLLWLLAAFGLTWIVNRSFFFAWLRRALPKPEGQTPFFGVLVRCPQCFGFWSGVLLHCAGLRLFDPEPSFLYYARDAFFSGLVASGICYAANIVLSHLGQGPIEEY